MNARLEKPHPSQRWRQKSEATIPSARGPLMTLIKIVTLLLLAGFLLFAHGCHGDKDNELFARVSAWMSASRR